MSKIVEVKTKAAAEKAIAAGDIVKIIAGTFALSVNVNATIIVAGNASPRIETRGTSSPRIDAWGTSSPSIETWGTSSPRIETWGTSSPRIVTRGTSSPSIETWEASSPSIETWGTSSPRIVTREASSPRINENSAPIPLIFLSGLRWRVTIAETRMTIGCQEHNLTRWWSFSDAQIASMDREYALQFWNEHKAALQAICQATGRPFAKVEAEAAA